jgi:hypothetical protein
MWLCIQVKRFNITIKLYTFFMSMYYREGSIGCTQESVEIILLEYTSGENITLIRLAWKVSNERFQLGGLDIASFPI